MLFTKMTRVVNVDIWNIWHMTFTGAILYAVTDNFWIGIVGVIIHSAFVYKLGDWFAPVTKNHFGLEELQSHMVVVLGQRLLLLSLIRFLDKYLRLKGLILTLLK